jgi:ketosteroid isomerase-like protein
VVVFLHEGAGPGGARSSQGDRDVFTVRGGRIAEARGYLDRVEALEAAGLEE